MPGDPPFAKRDASRSHMEAQRMPAPGAAYCKCRRQRFDCARARRRRCGGEPCRSRRCHLSLPRRGVRRDPQAAAARPAGAEGPGGRRRRPGGPRRRLLHARSGLLIHRADLRHAPGQDGLHRAPCQRQRRHGADFAPGRRRSAAARLLDHRGSGRRQRARQRGGRRARRRSGHARAQGHRHFLCRRCGRHRDDRAPRGRCGRHRTRCCWCC